MIGFALVGLLAVTAALLWFGVGAILGAPYLPVLNSEIDALLDLTELSAGQLLVDLGCGDGRILKAAARRGVRGIGYEINPVLCIIARINCWRYHGLVRIKWSNYWQQKLPEADAIYVFLISHFMPKLDRKLKAELKRPTAVVSFVYEILGRQPIRRTRNAWVYKYP